MGSRRVNPAASVAGSLQSVGMAEELRFQLELKRMEIEAATKERRIAVEAEERREARRLELETEERREARRMEAEAEARRLEVEERNEARRLDLEVRRLEVEKNRDFEWEISRLGANSTHKEGEGEENTVERQMIRSLQLIPDFDEQKVAEWFRIFEKKAAEFGWSEERWVGLVANKLKGRALEAYDNMSAEDLESYEDFKADILRACELRLEAYRLRFRGGKKGPGDSYLECAQNLEQAFKRWIMSEEVDSQCDLEELMVMEQFINAIDKELVPLLWEKRFKTLKEAATWADDHVLAHRSEPRAGGGFKEGGPRGPGGGGSPGSGAPRSPPRSHSFGNKSGFGKSQSPAAPSGPKGGSGEKMTFSTPKYDNQPTCYNCHAKWNFRSMPQTSDSGPLQDTPETGCLAGVA